MHGWSASALEKARSTWIAAVRKVAISAVRSVAIAETAAGRKNAAVGKKAAVGTDAKAHGQSMICILTSRFPPRYLIFLNKALSGNTALSLAKGLCEEIVHKLLIKVQWSDVLRAPKKHITRILPQSRVLLQVRDVHRRINRG